MKRKKHSLPCYPTAEIFSIFILKEKDLLLSPLSFVALWLKINYSLNSRAYECHHKGTKLTKNAQRAMTKTTLITIITIRTIDK
jgi:hypothetical protein